MGDIERIPRGSPMATFFSRELERFIHLTQTEGFDAGRAASCAVCIGAYIAAAYFPPDHFAEAVEKLVVVLRGKAAQALAEAREDREAGRLPPWPTPPA
jgi:hypothetical protein